jgi:(p)ppGpp synthase/HD superfamily hydrolase
MDRKDKLKISLRYWALGMAEHRPDYYGVVRALDLAERYHIGTRKDGETPEIQHQLEIAQYLRTLAPSLQYPAETLCAALLHDLQEDYSVTTAEVHEALDPSWASWTGTPRVLAAIERLNKHRVVSLSMKKHLIDYLAVVEQCPIASVIKGADRVNNLQSMLGVFSFQKQVQYAEEAKEGYLPMLKRARRRFPEQELVYENLKLMMTSQLELLTAIHSARGG